ncbi:MAG: metallophosphoesterase, partial [bacterium]
MEWEERGGNYVLYQYFRRPSFPSPGQGNTGKATVRRRLGIKSTVAFSLLLALLLTLSTVTFAAGSDPIYLGFTSDVHDQTERLRTWIDNLKPSAPTLDRMIFGGDYPDRMKENTSWTIAQQCVAIVQAAFDPNTPCVLVRGNHDKQDGNYAQGLVYNGDDYAVYAMDVDSSAFTSWSFFKSDIDELAAELDRIDASKPVFVASHIPIHYYSGRTIGNADALLTVLNRHENVIFLWGHNHTVNDPYYGKVMTEGFKIKTTSSGAEQAINFTYLAHGSILDGNYGAYGLLAALAEDGDDTKIDFSFKDLDGEAVSGGSVIIGGDAASGNIDSVALTGIRVPKTGETPDTTATTSSNKYTASAVSWDPADSPFAADTAYTASVTLTAKSGYNFTASTEATINGNDATNVTLDTEDTLIVSYTFPKTSAASGTTYQLTSSLESGETYVIVAQSGSDYYALTNATASSNFLAATSVKVQNDAVVASD